MEQKERAERAEEKTIKLYIKSHQELGASMEVTLQRIIEEFGLSEKEASSKLTFYWKKEQL